MKFARQHSNDAALSSIDRDRLPKCFLSSTESVLPDFVAKDYRAGSASYIFTGKEVPSEHRYHTQCVKKACTNASTSYLPCSFCRANSESAIQGIRVHR